MATVSFSWQVCEIFHFSENIKNVYFLTRFPGEDWRTIQAIVWITKIQFFFLNFGKGISYRTLYYEQNNLMLSIIAKYLKVSPTFSSIMSNKSGFIIQSNRFNWSDVFLPFSVFVTSKNTVYFVHDVVMNNHNMFVNFLVVLLEEREDYLVEYKTLRKKGETRVRKQKWKDWCVCGMKLCYVCMFVWMGEW